MSSLRGCEECGGYGILDRDSRSPELPQKVCPSCGGGGAHCVLSEADQFAVAARVGSVGRGTTCSTCLGHKGKYKIMPDRSRHWTPCCDCNGDGVTPEDDPVAHVGKQTSELIEDKAREIFREQAKEAIRQIVDAGEQVAVRIEAAAQAVYMRMEELCEGMMSDISDVGQDECGRVRDTRQRIIDRKPECCVCRGLGARASLVGTPAFCSFCDGTGIMGSLEHDKELRETFCDNCRQTSIEGGRCPNCGFSTTVAEAERVESGVYEDDVQAYSSSNPYRPPGGSYTTRCSLCCVGSLTASGPPIPRPGCPKCKGGGYVMYENPPEGA